jgi:hypothetical protein
LAGAVVFCKSSRDTLEATLNERLPNICAARVMVRASGGDYVRPELGLATWQRASSMWCRA